MSVTLNKSMAPTMHIHVGHNVPGYLPESDVLCFDNVEDALDALRHGLKDQQDYYWDNCDTLTLYQGSALEMCECAWCDVAGDCEAALSAIADGDAAWVFRTQDCVGWILSPPEGPDVYHWAVNVHESRQHCEIYADQES